MAAVPMLLLVIGQFVLPRSKRSIRVWFDPIVLEIDGEFLSFKPGTPMGRLSGRDLVYSYFKQWHDFEIVTHRFLLLGAIGLASLAAMWFALRIRIEFIVGGTVFYYYVLALWLVFVARPEDGCGSAACFGSRV
jgi:hypothetical protein